MITIEGNRDALYQWDLNQRVVLTNIDIGKQVHFADINDADTCPVVLSYEENGNVYANIPNILLQKSGIITAYVYVCEENKAYTEHSIEILVIPRRKPDDYIYTETEVLSYESLEKRIKYLEENAVPEELIEESVDKYLTKNPIEIKTDETLKYSNGVLGVNMADEVNGDNTLPISSAAVHTTVGNIEAILKTI